MAILAAVLHISDIEFETDPQTDGVFVKNDDVLVLGKYSIFQSLLTLTTEQTVVSPVMPRFCSYYLKYSLGACTEV